MELYLAPLEGISGYIFRNAVRHRFGDGISKYFTPFIEPHVRKKNLTHRELNDILPEHNSSLFLVPQIMTNSSEAFLLLEKELSAFGYKELNINLGCPSGTVTSKGRGAGLLTDPDRLDSMLYGIFEKTECAISVKTRIGFSEAEEWPEILDIFNKYPLREIIIHPRVREEYYDGCVHLDAFYYALNSSDHKICYNGDINSVNDYYTIKEQCIEHAGRVPDALMCGRGMLMDPTLLCSIYECENGAFGSEGCLNHSEADPEAILSFTEDILQGYLDIMSGETPALHKMKEIWTWLSKSYPDNQRKLKRIVKAKNVSDYRAAVRDMLFG